jgi:hypothetical protein
VINVQLRIGDEEELVIDILSQRLVFTQLYDNAAYNVSIPITHIDDIINILQILKIMIKLGVVSSNLYRIQNKNVIGTPIAERSSNVQLCILYSDDPSFRTETIVNVTKDRLEAYEVNTTLREVT